MTPATVTVEPQLNSLCECSSTCDWAFVGQVVDKVELLVWGHGSQPGDVVRCLGELLVHHLQHFWTTLYSAHATQMTNTISYHVSRHYTSLTRHTVLSTSKRI